MKWVLIVLAAGFIGQFGKRLADFLVGRARRRRAAAAAAQSPTSAPEELAPTPKNAGDAASKAAAKTAKKAAKAEVKRAKKADAEG